MDDKERNIRIRLSANLCKMAERILRRENPFDQLPLQEEFASNLYRKYLQYYDDIDEQFRRRILLMIVGRAHEYIQMGAHVPEKGSFYSRFPEHIKAEEEFKEWITRKEGDKSPIENRSWWPDKVQVSKIIKRIMKSRMPEFKYDKWLGIPGEIPFSTPLLIDNKVYIVADRGSKRLFIDFMVGIFYPECSFDISYFFSRAQSRYRYHTEEEVIAATNNALDLIKVLLPHFVDAVKNAFEITQDGSSQGERFLRSE